MATTRSSQNLEVISAVAWGLGGDAVGIRMVLPLLWGLLEAAQAPGAGWAALRAAAPPEAPVLC